MTDMQWSSPIANLLVIRSDDIHRAVVKDFDGHTIELFAPPDHMKANADARRRPSEP